MLNPSSLCVLIGPETRFGSGQSGKSAQLADKLKILEKLLLLISNLTVFCKMLDRVVTLFTEQNWRLGQSQIIETNI
jgi:hypothetical protein